MSGRFYSFIAGLVALIAASPGAFAADNPIAGFDAANKLYEQGNFTNAAAEYRRLVESGPVSTALFFNLGNAYFKSDELGRAIAAYREAAHLAPRDSDVRANLQFVRNQVQGQTLAPGRWERGLGRLTVNEWTVLVSVVLWVWLMLLTAVQLWPALKPTLRGFLWLSGVAAAGLAFCLGAALSADSTAIAIVIGRDAAVHNGPLEESPAPITVHDGAELRVVDHKDDWVQVSVSDRNSGWLRRDQVILVSRN